MTARSRKRVTTSRSGEKTSGASNPSERKFALIPNMRADSSKRPVKTSPPCRDSAKNAVPRSMKLAAMPPSNLTEWNANHGTDMASNALRTVNWPAASVPVRESTRTQ